MSDSPLRDNRPGFVPGGGDIDDSPRGRASRSGAFCFEAGWTRDENPWPEGTQEHGWWDQGWELQRNIVSALRTIQALKPGSEEAEGDEPPAAERER